jgi:oligoendopeptidase F
MIATLLLFAVLAADPAVPRHFDLERHLFPSANAEARDLALLKEQLEAFRRSEPSMLASGAALYDALQLSDRIQRAAGRHSTYHYLRASVDTRDQASAAAQAAIEADAAAAANLMTGKLQALDEVTLARFLAEKPELAEYRFAIDSARRLGQHVLPPAEEALLAALRPAVVEWPNALYHQLIARTNFGTVATPSGPLDVLRQRGAINNSPDPAVREEGARLLWAGYNSQRDLYATALLGTVRARNTLARLRHYDDAPAESYFRAWLTTTEVRSLIARIRPRAALYKRFQRIAAERARSQRASGVAATVPRFTIDQASATIERAMAPLGPDYSRELAALLDPANGRLDLEGGEHRAGGGSSTGSGVATSGVYLNAFEGYYADVSRLAHEAGHAVQNQFELLDRVPAVYTTGADYLSEAYALFHELVLADSLFQRATDPDEKAFYQARFLDKAMEVFHGAQDAELEQAIYDGVAAGKIANADDLDALTKQVDEAYSIAGETRPEVRARWITARLLYEDPLYLFNYMESGILALELFRLYTAGPSAFAPKYVALLRAGYRGAPADAMRSALGIDLRDPELLDRQVAMLEARTNYFVKTVTSADEPIGAWSAGGPFHETRIGTRCTTFTKLPEALSGGRSENEAPVPPERLSTFPSNSRPPSASILTVAR